jgi:hypothetical protein
MSLKIIYNQRYKQDNPRREYGRGEDLRQSPDSP